jgi:hypothetical protein
MAPEARVPERYSCMLSDAASGLANGVMFKPPSALARGGSARHTLFCSLPSAETIFKTPTDLTLRASLIAAADVAIRATESSAGSLLPAAESVHRRSMNCSTPSATNTPHCLMATSSTSPPSSESTNATTGLRSTTSLQACMNAGPFVTRSMTSPTAAVRSSEARLGRTSECPIPTGSPRLTQRLTPEPRFAISSSIITQMAAFSEHTAIVPSLLNAPWKTLPLKPSAGLRLPADDGPRMEIPAALSLCTDAATSLGSDPPACLEAQRTTTLGARRLICSACVGRLSMPTV